MPKKFCPLCGKDTEELYERLCKECFLKRTVILDAPKQIEAGYCRKCGRIFSGKTWGFYDDFGSAVEDIIVSNSKLMPGADMSVSFDEPEDMIPQEPIRVLVRAETEVEGRKVVETRETSILFRQKTCDACAMMSGGYFETVLQIRGEKKDDILGFIEKRLGELSSANKSSYITRVEEKKEGFDVYVGGKSPARKVAEEAKRIYRLETKRTYTQHGVKNGKEVFRETILLRS